MKIAMIALLAACLCSGCASEIEAYTKANPASERSGKIGVWKGLGVELTLWEYEFKGKAKPAEAKP